MSLNQKEFLQVSPQLGNNIQWQIFNEALGSISAGERTRLFHGKLLHLPHSVKLQDVEKRSTLKEIVNPSLLKVIQMANPAGQSFIPEVTAALGGWCCFFTGDLNLIAHGMLPDPISGEGKPLQSINQFVNWIQTSIRFDQIVEAIYPLNVSSHVGIDEVLLWTEKIIQKIEPIFLESIPESNPAREAITQNDRLLFFHVLNEVGKKRAQFTTNFLRLITGNPNLIMERFTDQKIWTRLNSVKNELFELAGLDEIQKGTLASDGLLWSQYTGPYLEILKEAGIVQRNITAAIFSEPIQHASPFLPKEENLRKGVENFFGIVFDGKNTFLRQGGINHNVTQIAMMPCFGLRGKINPANNTELPISKRKIPSIKGTRQFATVADVPNLLNWPQFLDDLKPNIVPGTLAESNIFLWSANILTTFDEPVILMMELANIFRSDPNSQNNQARIRSIQGNLKDWLSLIISQTFSE